MKILIWSVVMDLSQSTIAITGATGFLGSHIALELLDRGAKVRGVVRSPEKGAGLAERGVDFVAADLMDVNALTEAFSGVDAVVSNAALFTMKRASWEDFYKPNKVGTENVYTALRDAKVKRVVQVSTIGVYKPKLFSVTREDSPKLTERDRKLNWNYAVTKAMSEEIAWDLAKEYGLDLSVVRPGPIYGPRDRNMVPIFARLMRWPVMLAPTFGLPAVHAADVALAILGSLENDDSIGQAYNAAGPPVSIAQFMRTWKQVAGQGPALIPVWTPLKMRIDTTAAERDLGFQNRPLELGLADTLGE
jgi:nucleoside-diphosphate-sugar epimerase